MGNATGKYQKGRRTEKRKTLENVARHFMETEIYLFVIVDSVPKLVSETLDRGGSQWDDHRG